MLKYSNIIEKLSDDQKISLITDIKSWNADWLKEFGVPLFSAAQSDDFSVPNFCWDEEFIRQKTCRVARASKEKGANVVNVPKLDVRIGKNAEGFSEDPLLNGKIGKAFADGAFGGGLTTMVGDVSLKKENAEFLDIDPDYSAIHDVVFAPYFRAASSEGCGVAVISTERINSLYSHVNSEFAFKLLKEKYPQLPIISGTANAAETIRGLNAGVMSFTNGSSDALAAATEKFREIDRSVRLGSVTLNEETQAMESGLAVSDEALDENADKVLDFLFLLGKVNASENIPDNIGDLHTKEVAYSAVLLKNQNGVLPISSEKSFVVIGDFAQTDNAENIVGELKDVGGNCVGYAKGYNFENQTDEKEIISEAAEIASQAEIALVFLNEQKGSLHVSANRIALLNALKGKNCKVVAVLDSDSLDVSFENLCDGILLTSLDGTDGRAFAEILFGKVSPAGKLGKNICRNNDVYFQSLLKRRNTAGKKVGKFYGYRFTETQNFPVAFPFGHGLTYSEVEYSDITAKNGKVTVTLTNRGSYEIFETVEVYAGVEQTKCALPAKQLIGFAAVKLSSGETKQAEIEIGEMSDVLSVYDSQSERCYLEGGSYTIFVGRSAQDIKGTATIMVTARGNPQKHNINEYLLHTSNIESGGYRLKNNNLKKRKKGLTVFAVLFNLVTLAFLIMLYSFLYQSPNSFSYLIMLGVAGAAILAVIAVDVLTVRHNKRVKKETAQMRYAEAQNDEQWKNEDIANVASLAGLWSDDEELKDIPVEKETVAPEVVFNGGFSFETACENFVKHCSERGMAVSFESAKGLFAAMASSRLLILRSDDKSLLQPLISLLREYFDGLFNTVSRFDNVENLFGVGGFYDFAVECARRTDRVCFQVATDVNLQNTKSCILPLIRYFGNPESNPQVVFESDGHAKSCVLPKNIWFLLVEDDGRGLVPDFVSEFAVVVTLDLSAKEYGVEKIAYKTPRVDQMMFATRAKRDELQFAEQNWRKIDQLESVVCKIGNYEIDNRKWGQVEKFISVYLSCENISNRIEAERAALDRTIASTLASGMATVVAFGEPREEKFSETVEKVLGENDCLACEKILGYYTAESIA